MGHGPSPQHRTCAVGVFRTLFQEITGSWLREPIAHGRPSHWPPQPTIGRPGMLHVRPSTFTFIDLAAIQTSPGAYMSDFTIDRRDIPLWTGAKGAVHVLGSTDLTKPPVPGTSPIVAATFNADGTNAIGLGASDSISIGVKAGATASIDFVWASHH